ncbi:MAG: hypothetical protein MMC33_007870 [Icmadophila ericetorum]|nr:hypothetical protein [Icmadophila ericetorum]
MKSTLIFTILAALTAGTSAIETAGETPCTTTLTLPAPTFNDSPTTTIYDRTVTSTSTVDCAGCVFLATTTRFLGVGPVRPVPTTTVTELKTVVETYKCRPSPMPLMFAA